MEKSRHSYVNVISGISELNAQWKPASDVWNPVEITEHLYWAEHGGVFGMWKTLHAIREGTFPRTFESKHKNLTVEEVVDLTWQPKELVPPVAAPRMGGTLAFWRSGLDSLQSVLVFCE